jgi:membrane dipeptidase
MNKFVLAFGLAALASPLAAQSPEAVAEAALRAAPVWDGHNDVPEQLRDRRGDVLDGFDFNDTRNEPDGKGGTKPMHTDFARLAQGHVGAQFWSVYVSADLPEPEAVVATMQQIDVTKRLVARYPDRLALALTAADVERAMKQGRIASLIGMEGGHSIDGSLAVLRQMYDLGARYMTLTHSKNNAWADSATAAPVHDGLTDFGRDVVREMNRVGMLVDCSHCAHRTTMEAIEASTAPVVFSHSNARRLCDHERNIRDDQIRACAATGGLVGVTGVGRFLGPRGPVIDHLVEHIDHMVGLVGPAHVGVGMDSILDGYPVSGLLAEHRDYWPQRQYPDGGLGFVPPEDFPRLTEALLARGYADGDVRGILGENYLRVAAAVWK